ncbi:MAG: hypothetical protein NDJ90_09950 [Oligoflexia bacterium]|nr:hypothetical protein [Oligoflexia bacterium]
MLIVLALGCSNTSHPGGSLGGPTNGGQSHQVKPPAPSNPSAPNPGPQPGEEDVCIAARTIEEAKGAVCSTQGKFSYLTFRGQGLLNPASLSLKLFSSGDSSITLENPKLTQREGTASLLFSADHESIMEFDGFKFQQGERPDFGFVIIRGNSGQCLASRTGSYEACKSLYDAKNPGISDEFRLPDFPMHPPQVKFLYEKVRTHYSPDYRTYYLNQSSFDEAQVYCQELGARLPSNREFAEEMERLSWQSLIVETKYPDVALTVYSNSPTLIADPDLKSEALAMQEQGYVLAIKNDSSGRSVADFYLRRSTAIDTGLIQSLGGMISYPCLFLQTAFSNRRMHLSIGNNGDFGFDQKCSFICVKDVPVLSTAAGPRGLRAGRRLRGVLSSTSM